MTTIEKAIAYAEEHRQIHLDWIDYWRDYPPETAEDRACRSHVGGIKHQQWAVSRYNVILKALRSK